jgi:4'-phosphopantetheinyl transferase
MSQLGRVRPARQPILWHRAGVAAPGAAAYHVAEMLETLAPGDVDVWIAMPREIEDPALHAAYDALMTDDERAKQRAFVFERNQRESLLTRALARTTLSRYRAVAPAAWRFVRNDHGRPYVDPPCGLFFNLSNHPTMVVCAVTEGVEIGVDVEPIDRGAAVVELAPTVFAVAERSALDRLGEPARHDRAISLWTLKESYIKARGKGLALPLDAFAFHFDEAAPRITFEPPIEDVPARWWFHTVDVAGHRVALTVERAGSRPPAVRVRTCVPLREPGDAGGSR